VSDALPPPAGKFEFLARIDVICAIFRCSVTSGNRTRKRNILVGGHENSQHLVAEGGLACDLVPDYWPPKNELLVALHQAGLRFLVESDHVHVQARKPGGGA